MGLHTGEAVSTDTGYVGMDVHRAARICAAGHGGQILLSDATRVLTEKDLPPSVSLRDLGQHRLKDLASPEHIFQAVAGGLPSEFPPIKSLDTLPNNLPRYLTTFVGREREIGEVKKLLSGTYLLTLTGPGGVGKTRLALQVTADLLEAYPDGVWLVELGQLMDANVVAQTVASTLGVREQPGRPLLATLTDYLQPKDLLLVLENCEHLIAACAQLTDTLLRACPKLRVLATSREPLAVAGETVWSVPPLSLPDPRQVRPTEHFPQSDAVRLFTERARAALPTFSLTGQNAQAVAHVCSQLDGIPLAIELAAARVNVLPVGQIASRLDDRFRFLTGGSRTALPRLQTLRAAIDWSYDLLSESERVVFRRLSVFTGGWTLDGAEAVCAGTDIKVANVLALLISLVEKTLVIAEDLNKTGRYRMLETLRQYSRDRLVESGEARVVHRRHLDFLRVLAAEAEPHLTGPRQEEWLNRLETEHDNLRTALDWSRTDEDDVDEYLRLVGALSRFWVLHGHISEGRGWIEEALVRGGTASVRAKVLVDAGYLAWYQGDYVRTTTLCEEGLQLARTMSDERLIARAKNVLGLVAREQKEYSTAVAFFEESLDLYRKVGDARAIAIGLHNLGLVALYQSDFIRATSLHEESLHIMREFGDKWGIAIALHYLGLAARHRGDYAKAAAWLQQSLTLSRALNHKREIAETLEGLAGVAIAQQAPKRAARVLGAAEVLREAIAVPLTPAERVDYERVVVLTQTALGRDVFAAVWTTGRAMMLEEAIEYALSDA
jgi:predicted ATPase